MKRYFITSVICLISLNVLFAQQSDSLMINSIDSLSVINKQENKEKSCSQKTGKILSIAIPSAMITYGLISLGDNGIRQLDYDVQKSIADNNAFWDTRADDYLQFSPAIAAFGMKLCGVKSTHKLYDMAILYALSNVLETGIVYTTKTIVARERPSGSNNHSFPSGHTATAFVAAEFLHQEYKDKSIWISVGGYTMASFIGVARIYNNAHWLSDVVAGAGIGILSTKVMYWVYPYIQKAFCPQKNNENSKNTNQAFIFPSYNHEGLSLNFSYTF